LSDRTPVSSISGGLARNLICGGELILTKDLGEAAHLGYIVLADIKMNVIVPGVDPWFLKSF
jgi:hypothetical protein